MEDMQEDRIEKIRQLSIAVTNQGREFQRLLEYGTQQYRKTTTKDKEENKEEEDGCHQA